MIVEISSNELALLRQKITPLGLRLEEDVELAPPAVLEMLAALAAKVEKQFYPPAWMLVEKGEIVGLMSITRLPAIGEIHIGYGVGPMRQGRGNATRAVADLLVWAREDRRVRHVSAETGIENIASQRVLERNGFMRIGERTDPEDGRLICWKIETA